MKVLALVAVSLTCILARHPRGPHHPMDGRPTGEPPRHPMDHLPWGPHHLPHHLPHHMRPTGRPDDRMDFWKDWRSRIDAWSRKKMMTKEDSDETEVIEEPYASHLADFKGHMKNFIKSLPTGRPVDVKAMRQRILKKYKAVMKSLMEQRPTGRPEAMKDHNSAIRKLKAMLTKSKKYIKKLRSQPKDSDETEVLSEPYASHLSDFKGHMKKLFRNQPTGRPVNAKAMRQRILKKYKAVMNSLKEQRPTGRPEAMKDHKSAMNKLKAMLNRSKNYLKKLQSQPKDSDETEVLSKPYAPHLKAFKSHLKELWAGRPTEQPFRGVELKEKMTLKFKEIKAQLKALRPTGRPREEDALEAHGKSLKTLKKMYDNFKKQILAARKAKPDEADCRRC